MFVQSAHVTKCPKYMNMYSFSCKLASHKTEFSMRIWIGNALQAVQMKI